MPSDDLSSAPDSSVLWIDFVNTGGEGDAPALDALAVPEDLDAWLRAAAGRPPRAVVEDDLIEARKLRAQLRMLAERCTAGLDPPRLVLNAIDDALAATRGSMRLHSTVDRRTLEFEPEASAPAAVLWPVLHSIARWLVGADRARLRKCADARCPIYFYDTSKNRRRRWCSMAVCGNRAKARAFHGRNRKS